MSEGLMPTRLVTRVLLVAEFPGALDDDEVQDRLDAFRERALPGRGLLLYRPENGDLEAFGVPGDQVDNVNLGYLVCREDWLP